MKKTKIISALLLGLLALSPVTASFAETNSGSTAIGKDSKTQGTIKPMATGNGGTATLKCIAIGDMKMDADYTLTSTQGPINWVNAVITWDNGVVTTQKYGAASSTVYGSAQWQFSSKGYHTATLSGWDYADLGLIEQTIIPITKGATVY
jgi:hypothetical protein